LDLWVKPAELRGEESLIQPTMSLTPEGSRIVEDTGAKRKTTLISLLGGWRE
jgi:hypothetical protein